MPRNETRVPWLGGFELLCLAYVMALAAVLMLHANDYAKTNHHGILFSDDNKPMCPKCRLNYPNEAPFICPGCGHEETFGGRSKLPVVHGRGK